MLDIKQANIARLGITWVGNKDRYEGVSVPNSVLLPVDDYAHELLITTLLKPFLKNEEFHYFHHNEDVTHHPVYQQCMELFGDDSKLQSVAVALTQQLYEYMEGDKLKGGELFIALIDGITFLDQDIRAIALLKVQSRANFLRTERSPEAFILKPFEGIGLEKPELAALVLQLDELEGYRVAVLDTFTKKDERSFWKDSFLRLQPIEDHFFHTTHHMSMASEFIIDKMPIAFGVNKADQADLLNRSALYFKENDHFNVEAFSDKLFDEPEQQEAFLSYRDQYAQGNAIPLEDAFDISNQAVRKQMKHLKSVIKLDKNFHLYVHGRRDLIEKGFDDDRQLKYYKVFFTDEE
jgi:37-kD nucleoid-associated bacterial protein